MEGWADWAWAVEIRDLAPLGGTGTAGGSSARDLLCHAAAVLGPGWSIFDRVGVVVPAQRPGTVRCLLLLLWIVGGVGR